MMAMTYLVQYINKINNIFIRHGFVYNYNYIIILVIEGYLFKINRPSFCDRFSTRITRFQYSIYL